MKFKRYSSDDEYEEDVEEFSIDSDDEREMRKICEENGENYDDYYPQDLFETVFYNEWKLVQKRKKKRKRKMC